MEVAKTALEGPLIIRPDVFADARGAFFEDYNETRYHEAGITETFVQDNVSASAERVLRGLHYQEMPFAQAKLVEVLKGKALDVAVDIRNGSPTFGQHVAVELSGGNRLQFFIPAGFAHGFLSLEEGTIFRYKCTALYSKEHDRGILWNDPALAIEWGMDDPLLSEKDTRHPLLAEVSKETLYF